jgi:hypothetical protein
MQTGAINHSLRGGEMRRASSLVTLLVVACGGAWIGGARDRGRADGKVVMRIRCSDIPANVKLIGPLGTALGEEMVTIRGKWKEKEVPTKGENFNLIVSQINGKQLHNPIALPAERIEPHFSAGKLVHNSPEVRTWTVNESAENKIPKAYDGDEWELKGYETARTAGRPRNFGRLAVQEAYQAGTLLTGFRFKTIRHFGKPHKEEELDGGWTFDAN